MGKKFYKLFIANVISSAGDIIQDFAVMWYILTRTENVGLASLSLFLNYLPKIIFGPYAGVLADKNQRRAS